MNVKIGFTESPRELLIEMEGQREDVLNQLRAALKEGEGVLELSDAKGRTYLINSSEVAYVEVGTEEQRMVGFAGV